MRVHPISAHNDSERVMPMNERPRHLSQRDTISSEGFSFWSLLCCFCPKKIVLSQLQGEVMQDIDALFYSRESAEVILSKWQGLMEVKKGEVDQFCARLLLPKALEADYDYFLNLPDEQEFRSAAVMQSGEKIKRFRRDYDDFVAFFFAACVHATDLFQDLKLGKKDIQEEVTLGGFIEKLFGRRKKRVGSLVQRTIFHKWMNYLEKDLIQILLVEKLLDRFPEFKTILTHLYDHLLDRRKVETLRQAIENQFS